MQSIKTSAGGIILERQVDMLESRLCDYTGSPRCMLADSERDGMLLALQAAGVGYGDSVFCTTLGFYATPQAVAELQATPVFVDINPNTFNIDPFCLEYVIGKYRRRGKALPKALIAVDLFGLACNYPALESICRQNGITLIEDMTQAFGARIGERRAGSFGRFAVSGLIGNEAGEGGVVFCRSGADDYILRGFRDEQPRIEARQGVFRTGLSSSMSVVGEMLDMWDDMSERRRMVAELYKKCFSGAVKTQEIPQGYASVYNQFVISLSSSEQRAFVMDSLMREHIPCTIYYPVPLHRREAFTGWDRVVLVNAELVSEKLLALPMHPYLSEGIVNNICGVVTDAVNKFREKTRE